MKRRKAINSSPTRRHFGRRWLFLISIIMLILVFTILLNWCQRSRSSNMRLVSRIPFCKKSDYIVFSSPDAGLMLHKDTPMNNNEPSTISLIGWDEKPRWKATMPIHTLNFFEDDWRQLTFGGHHAIALSPDGHILALAIGNGKTVQITLWRDGHFVGNMHIVLPSRITSWQTICVFSASNMGRIWLLAQYKEYCQLWTFDGKIVSSGTYIPSIYNVSNEDHLCASSPDGTVLLCYTNNDNALIEYNIVQIQGTFVHIINKYIAKNLIQYILGQILIGQ